MKVWAVKKWNATFENAASRKVNRLSYGNLPLDQGSLRFKRLMQTSAGAAAFGHFMSIVQVAATCPHRGLLFRSDRAMDIIDVAAQIGVPSGPLKKSWAVLSSPEIGWLYQVEVAAADLSGCIYIDPQDKPIPASPEPHADPSRTPREPQPDPTPTPRDAQQAEQSREKKRRDSASPLPPAAVSAPEPEDFQSGGTALPACQTPRDALIACGVGEPSLSQLARANGITVEEIQREWAGICDTKKRRRPILDPVSVLVRTLQTAHGVTIKPKSHVAGAVHTLNDELLKLRKHRATA